MFAFSRKDVDARVVGSALVVSFTGTDVTKTWRADMAAVATATLEVREDGKKFSVVMKHDKTEEVIASFSERESAVYALSAITEAMLKGDTQVVAAQGGKAMLYMTRAFKAVVILLLLCVVFAIAAPAIFGPGSFERVKSATRGNQQPASRIKPGEPIPADQLFGGK